MSEITKGLYRKYNNEYVLVLGTIYDTDRCDTLVRYMKVKGDDKEYCVTKGNFLSDEYEHTLVDEKGIHTEMRKIENHPANCTGQKECFLKIIDLENFGVNLSTDALVEELQRRWDSPLHDFDIEDFNSRVWCTEYIVGVPIEPFMFGGTERPANVGVKSICDTLEEAQKDLIESKVMGNYDCKIYKRVYVEEKGAM